LAMINKQKTGAAEHEMKWCDLDLDGYTAYAQKKIKIFRDH